MPTKFTGSFDTTKVADGPLTFTATARDSAGNSSTLSWHVIVDNTPPAIAFTQPVVGAYYSAVVPAASKPAPGGIHRALGQLRVDADRALHIGDSESDERAARAAGVRFLPAPLTSAVATLA